MTTDLAEDRSSRRGGAPLKVAIAVAALGVFPSVFVQATHVRLEPGVKDGDAHLLEKLADPIAPAGLLLRRPRRDKIHRARKINARALQQPAF